MLIQQLILASAREITLTKKSMGIALEAGWWIFRSSVQLRHQTDQPIKSAIHHSHN
jgi:hypothetical protein